MESWKSLGEMVYFDNYKQFFPEILSSEYYFPLQKLFLIVTDSFSEDPLEICFVFIIINETATQLHYKLPAPFSFYSLPRDQDFLGGSKGIARW